MSRAAARGLCGYIPLRAAGERVVSRATTGTDFRWCFLIFCRRSAASLCGLADPLRPETRGGGGDAAIDAFHYKGGDVPTPRAVGQAGRLDRDARHRRLGRPRRPDDADRRARSARRSARYLSLTGRERRMLMVAGIAAGISAVFRTPLGAALLAIEVLYRDDFESEALIPAVLASVIAYSVALSVFGRAAVRQPAALPVPPQAAAAVRRCSRS